MTCRRTAALAIAVALTAALAMVLGISVRDNRGELADIDQSVAEDLHGWAGDSDERVDGLRVLTDLGDSVTLHLVTAAVAAAALAGGHRRLAVFTVAVALGGALLNRGLKELLDRPRPRFFDPLAPSGGPSYPSGHAMNSAVVYGLVAVAIVALAPRRVRVPALTLLAVIVLTVGFTRVALGVHFASDVAGAWLVAFAWVASGMLLARPAPARGDGQAVTSSRGEGAGRRSV